jgi:hypothetical protein
MGRKEGAKQGTVQLLLDTTATAGGGQEHCELRLAGVTAHYVPLMSGTRGTG